MCDLILIDSRHEHDIQNAAFNLPVDHYRLDLQGSMLQERACLVEQLLPLPIIFYLLNTNASEAVTDNFLKSFKVH